MIKYHLITAGSFHIGTGIGIPGQIDDLVVKDQDQFPRIPASHIRGIIRENIFQLAGYLDKEDMICKGQHAIRRGSSPSPNDFCPDESPCILCSLTGSPIREGVLWFSDAHYDIEYREFVKRLAPQLATKDQSVSTHVTIERTTGRSKPNQLFSLEFVDTDNHFVGEIDLMHIPQIDQTLLGWLLASMLFTRKIGGRRRRGWGNCRIEILNIPSEMELKDVINEWVAEVTK